MEACDSDKLENESSMFLRSTACLACRYDNNKYTNSLTWLDIDKMSSDGITAQSIENKSNGAQLPYLGNNRFFPKGSSSLPTTA